MKNKHLIIVILILIAVYTFVYISIYDQSFMGFKKSLVSDGNSESEKVRTVVINEEDATINVVREASPAVVSVIRKDFYYDYWTGPIEQEDSIGTGFIIDGDRGIVLTNKHVVDDEQASYSVLYKSEDGTNREYDAIQIARDPLHDFSILRIEMNNGESLPELPLGDSDNLVTGQTVIAIGNALGEFGNSATKGIISGLNRGIYASSGIFGTPEFIEDVIQTDAALNPGNSGGPLLNLNSEVVGINVAVSGSAENIGFSIPVNTIKPAIDQFNQRGKISRPFLGVQYRVVTPDIADLRGIPEGVFVEDVVRNSPAENAGIRPGDIITALDGVSINQENSLARLISEKQIDERVVISVYRDDQYIDLRATLKDAEE